MNLPQWWESVDKLVDLIAPAIYECLIAISPDNYPSVPLLIGIACPETQFLGDYEAEQLLTKIEAKLNVVHHPLSVLLPFGQSSGIHAIQLAEEYFASQNINHCIIAGVDSYLSRQHVDHYTCHRRLMTEDNSNGFFLSEAGAATLLAKKEAHPEAVLQLKGFGLATEEVTIESEEPFMVKGMTAALQNLVNAIKPITLQGVTWSMSDLNGEQYKSHEINIALNRFSEYQKPVGMEEITHPIEYLGEIGAAIVPCLLNYALYLGERNDHFGQYVLFHTSNDQMDRGVLLGEFING